MSPAPAADAGREDGEDNARLLGALTRNREGRRQRDFRDAVGQMRQEVMGDFPLTGERSFKWL